jgi:hypothetical protein
MHSLSSPTLGSKHNFAIHKKEHGRYVMYLTKTMRECGLIAVE